MTTPAVEQKYETTPITVEATSCVEDFIVVATSKRDYYIYKDKGNFIQPVQETCPSASVELVCDKSTSYYSTTISTQYNREY